MAHQLFFDTNVLLDLSLKRTEFIQEVEELFSLKDQGEIEIYVSTLTLADIAYIAERHGLSPFEIVGKYLEWVRVIDLKKDFFTKVLNSNFKDFEDGLQYFAATSIAGIDAIITRNLKDFRFSRIPVYSPMQYLKIRSN